jgi:hypothetical protein
MTHLAELREVDDPYFQEQALLASLWTMDQNAFWYHFSRYVKLHPNQPIPIHYQEAAHLYGILEKRPDANRFPVGPDVKERHERFDEMASQLSGQDLPDVQKALEPIFGDTFYYHYYLMSNLPEY